MQLGHPVGKRCCRPWYVAKGEFIVVHINRIHVINLAFCGCETTETYSRQLLCYRWLPATADRPRTAATFQVLKDFHILLLELKLSCYEFYSALARHSDNTGLQPPKVCHSPLLLFHVLSHVRFVTSNSCVWYDNGAILKCLNVWDEATILPVFQIQNVTSAPKYTA